MLLFKLLTNEGEKNTAVNSISSATMLFFSFFTILVNLSFCLLICSALSDEGQEILLSPEVTYGPPGLTLSCPVALTIAHCADVSSEDWNIKLKRQAQNNSWEVRLT